MENERQSLFEKMMEKDRRSLFELINAKLDFEDLRVLCFHLGVDFDSLSGESKATKVVELIAYMDRQGRHSELAEAVQKVTSGAYTRIGPASGANILNIELASLRQQLVELQEAVTGEQLEHRLEEMLKTANRAVGRSQELTARVRLPRLEDMDVHLVPSHSLERLEEYRSDENVAYLLIGAFGGAVLGILANWATSEQFTITRFSIVLMLLLTVPTIACCFWARRLHQRAALVKEQMLHPSILPTESD